MGDSIHKEDENVGLINSNFPPFFMFTPIFKVHTAIVVDGFSKYLP